MSASAPAHEVRDVPEESRYELLDDGAVAAFVVYVRPADAPGVLDLQHTVTAPGHEGRGLAGELVAAVLAEAREQGWQVRPTCSYVRHYLGQHPDDLELVSAHDREAFELD